MRRTGARPLPRLMPVAFFCFISLDFFVIFLNIKSRTSNGFNSDDDGELGCAVSDGRRSDLSWSDNE